MKGGDRRCQRTHRRNLETPLDGHALIEVRLIELAHAQRPFDRLSRAPKPEKPVGREGYGHKVKIEVRCGSPVDAKLIETGLVPKRHSRKIEKRVFHRAFHFVGEGPRQKNARGVGVDALNGCRAIGIGSRQSHETQHFLLVVFALCHDVNHVRRIACLLCHRTFENIQKTARAPCWLRVNWLTFSAGGAALRYQPAGPPPPSPVPARRSSGPRPSPIPISCSPPSPARRSNMPRRLFR